MSMTIKLAGLTWDDPRGYGPLEAVDAAFSQTAEGEGVEVHWDVQSLGGFESAPLDQIARRYDLIVLDHPHTIEAVLCGCLVPVGDLDPRYVGLTCESYQWQDRQWAVPVDAACHVSAYNPNRIDFPPISWHDVFQLAAGQSRIAMPLLGVHALMALMTLLAADGYLVGPNPQDGLPTNDVLGSSLATLRRLADSGLRHALDWNPIDALTAVAEGACDYLPLTFAYEHFQNQGVRFANVPKAADGRPGRGILGGTGLGVSAHCEHPKVAIAYARLAGSADIQAGCWASHGGQPAHRAAWEALAKNDDGFYRQTLAAHDDAFVRPRFFGWNEVQSRAGEAINSWLRRDQAGTQLICEQLRDLWHEASQLSPDAGLNSGADPDRATL